MLYFFEAAATVFLLRGWLQWVAARPRIELPGWRRASAVSGLVSASLSVVLSVGVGIGMAMSQPLERSPTMLVIWGVLGLVLCSAALRSAALGQSHGRTWVLASALVMAARWVGFFLTAI